jgi:hypothetical protein
VSYQDWQQLYYALLEILTGVSCRNSFEIFINYKDKSNSKRQEAAQSAAS